MGDSALVLRNFRAMTFQDKTETTLGGEPVDAWPGTARLELDGFTYERLGGRYADGSCEMVNRPANWYVEWLARDPSYTPQPYQQLAHVFHGMGKHAHAEEVLYASRERERKEGARRLRSVGLWLLKTTIGYGLGARYWRSLPLLGLLVLLGAAVLWRPAGDGVTSDFWWCLGASVDWMLPFIELSQEFGEKITQEVSGLWLLLLYGQAFGGMLLASFLVAGLAGLTQNRGPAST